MTLFWGRRGDMWMPQGGAHTAWRDLEPGMLTVWDRQVWRIVEVRDVPVADWEDRDREYYTVFHAADSRRPAMLARAPSEETWAERPVYLIVIPASGGKRQHFRVRPYRTRTTWAFGDHYPVCADCGEPYPCREIDFQVQAQREMQAVERLEKIGPGACWHCNQPVTARQKSIEFAGDNLLLPGAPPAVFHLRRGKGCLSGAREYEKKWLAADPSRPRRLSCTGKLVIHVDGHECSEDPLCPGPHAAHGTFLNHALAAKYGQPTGCLRCVDALARSEAAESPEPPPHPSQGMLRLDEGGEGL